MYLYTYIMYIIYIEGIVIVVRVQYKVEIFHYEIMYINIIGVGYDSIV